MGRKKPDDQYLNGANPAAYLVTCNGKDSLGTVVFAISLRSIKPNDSVCAHCPVRRKCRYANNKHRLHLFASLQNDPSLKLPIHMTKFRK